MKQIKAFAIKNQENIMSISNKILLLQNLIKKALQALWFLTVQELRKLIFFVKKTGQCEDLFMVESSSFVWLHVLFSLKSYIIFLNLLSG